MKKKTTKLAFFAIIFTLLLFLPNMPETEAASEIVEILSDEEATAAIQEIVRVGLELKQGNTERLKTVVVQRALEEAGITGEVNAKIVEDMKAMTKDIKTADVVAQIAEQAVKEKVKARLSERLAPYANKLLLLEALFMPAENS
jgi:hypothetical protein